ncbi:MAG: hypothetical protein WCB04_12480 [Mycobacteriales bacterium]
MNPRTKLTAMALAGTGAVLSLLVTASAPAAANPAAGNTKAPGGWERYHAQSFTTAPGALCPFELHSQVLFDQEYVRTTSTYSDGSPRTQEYVGPLVVRMTNQSNGHSIVRDLSGRAVLAFSPDGSYLFHLQGPGAVGFHPGDSLPPGYYVLHGDHVIRFAADGTRTMVADHGTEENVCRTLA